MTTAKKNNWLLTLGITPSRPDTGYGYIQFNEGTVCPSDKRIHKVKTFTEKPNLELARTFMASGDFLWNAGIFIWTLKSINAAFDNYLPEVNQLFDKGVAAYNTPLEQEFITKAYSVCKNISIDYGIMERADNVHVLMSDFGWSDLGTWGSLYTIRPRDEKGNTVIGDNTMLWNSTNCIVNMPKEKLVVIQGLNDYIVVDDNDTLLICRKEDEQLIREIVTSVKETKGEQYV
jgi:mannose-1-phosphate guanylyltransferase